jgi:omega-amidase
LQSRFTRFNIQECFNSPYGTKYFKKYAEEIPTGESFRALSEMAAESKVFLVGGSIPEKVLYHDKESQQEQAQYHNTCCVFDPSGSLLTTYRKMHLFDIDIPGKIKFKESEVLSPGHRSESFQTRKSIPYFPV